MHGFSSSQSDISIDPFNDDANTLRSSPTLNVYSDYGWLRGFGVVPSWGARIEEAWWDYDGTKMREEIAPAKLFHANCIRLWIEFTAWMANPEQVTANFLDAVDAIGEAGMKVMPCLYNRWHDLHYDYGGTYMENLLYNGVEWDGYKIDNLGMHRDYIRALVTPLINDERILMWDLCNEPHAVSKSVEEMLNPSEMALPNANRLEFEWLANAARTVRECGARQPITIGTVGSESLDVYAGLCDVLCVHLYAQDRAGLEKQVAQYKDVREKLGKPMMVNETIPGGGDDEERGALAAVYNELLSDAGFGWMAWTLREGKAVASRRDRPDINGLHKVGFHPWVLKNGELRGGVEALTAKPKVMPPWHKAG